MDEQLKENLQSGQDELKERVQKCQEDLILLKKKINKMEREIENVKEQIVEKMEKLSVPASPVSVKLYTYDGKTSWEVYKVQFCIISEAIGWTEEIKACQLVASLREGCKNGRFRRLKSALLYALKLENVTQASCKDHHSIRGSRVTADVPCESPWLKEIEKLRKHIQDLMAQRQNLRRGRIPCWRCGGAGHLRCSCPHINKEDRNVKCWDCDGTGHERSNYP
ncbi:uncharacterized protein TNCV_3431321 [Trichonephila clavipes]|nr:uncharacterized protein TNCV_3431321 [Trichonephila clavipes]